MGESRKSGARVLSAISAAGQECFACSDGGVPGACEPYLYRQTLNLSRVASTRNSVLPNRERFVSRKRTGRYTSSRHVDATDGNAKAIITYLMFRGDARNSFFIPGYPNVYRHQGSSLPGYECSGQAQATSWVGRLSSCFFPSQKKQKFGAVDALPQRRTSNSLHLMFITCRGAQPHEYLVVSRIASKRTSTSTTVIDSLTVG